MQYAYNSALRSGKWVSKIIIYSVMEPIAFNLKDFYDRQTSLINWAIFKSYSKTSKNNGVRCKKKKQFENWLNLSWSN